MSEDSAPAGRAPGLLLPPTLIMTVLAIIYARYGDLDVLRRSLAGISCAAVGSQ
ncbi:chromate transport protein ChrA [Bradyrhizobium sp. SBR1B]|nr:chromate transport protein ChrA [Bradyrhizobium sp. SBR1B]